MINLNSILQINKKPIFLKSIKNSAKPHNNLNLYNFQGNNLKPLAFDTINFGNTLNTALLQAIDNKDVCEKLNKNAKKAAENLDKTLKAYLEDLIVTSVLRENYAKELRTPDETKIIASIDKRIKSPESIREKATEIFEAEFSKPEPKFFNIKNVDSIKQRLHDIIGERITLQYSEQQKGDVVLDRLIQAVKDGKLKIVRIENYSPLDLPKNIEYFSKEKLKELQEAVNSTLGENEKAVEIEYKSKKTGYMALHLDVDLSDGYKYPSYLDKYFGEIQIVGKDVAALKEVEDLCYKLKSNKAIKNNSINYKPFANYFLRFYKPEKNKKLAQYFEEYTSRAYLIQRQKAPHDPKSSILPTIEECGLKGKVPAALDFNILKAIKDDCDDLAKIQSNPQKALEEIIEKGGIKNSAEESRAVDKTRGKKCEEEKEKTTK